MQLSGEQIFEEFLKETLHRDTQVEPNRVSLTAGGIYELDEPGSLDFGGGELDVPDRTAVSPQKRDPDDDYGWWQLASEQYVLELNETVSLPPGYVARLSPHEHLTWGGATHTTLELDEEDNDVRLMVSLSVPDTGIKIKQNARVSSLRVYGPFG